MSRLVHWADDHREIALDLIRVYLGLGLFARGFAFLSDPAAFTSLLPGGAESTFASAAFVHYVGLAHLAGGLLLAVGMLTRLAALAQVPILAGAAFLVHLPGAGLFSQSFALAALVLALLAVFSLWGGGPWSLDRAVSRWSERHDAEERALADDTARSLRARPRLRAPAPNRAPEPALTDAAAPTDAPCGCGHDRSHPSVVPEWEYSGLSGLRFLTGTHARPSAVTLRCRDCGGVVEVVRAPDALEAYRYERTA